MGKTVKESVSGKFETLDEFLKRMGLTEVQHLAMLENSGFRNGGVAVLRENAEEIEEWAVGLGLRCRERVLMAEKIR